MSKAKVTKDMTIQEVIKSYPEVLEVLLEYGVGCAGCALSEFESVEQGAELHGIDLEEFLEDLNYVVAEYYH